MDISEQFKVFRSLSVFSTHTPKPCGRQANLQSKKLKLNVMLGRKSQTGTSRKTCRNHTYRFVTQLLENTQAYLHFSAIVKITGETYRNECVLFGIGYSLYQLSATTITF
jgi:hypothetical protein